LFELIIFKNLNPEFDYFNESLFYEYTYPQDEVCQCIKYGVVYNDDEMLGDNCIEVVYRIPDILSDADLIPYPTEDNRV
jgi:hypothetical protein